MSLKDEIETMIKQFPTCALLCTLSLQSTRNRNETKLKITHNKIANLVSHDSDLTQLYPQEHSDTEITITYEGGTLHSNQSDYSWVCILLTEALKKEKAIKLLLQQSPSYSRQSETETSFGGGGRGGGGSSFLNYFGSSSPSRLPSSLFGSTTFSGSESPKEPKEGKKGKAGKQSPSSKNKKSKESSSTSESPSSKNEKSKESSTFKKTSFELMFG